MNSIPDFTVLGARGFIGSHLRTYLENKGHVYCPNNIEECFGKTLGHVFYCIGMTANFRQNPLKTIESHVLLLKRILEEAKCASLVYLSSTRVYQFNQSGSTEASLLTLPSRFDDIYNISKILGETICLAHSKNCKVVRLSNVLGPDKTRNNFLFQVIDQARSMGRVEIHQSPEDSKDYIDIEDVCPLLHRIATQGSNPIYNVASGVRTSNVEIAEHLEKLKPGIEIHFLKKALQMPFPDIEISSLKEEFGYRPTPFAVSLAKLWEQK